MFLYFCNEAVPSSDRRGSGRPRYFDERILNLVRDDADVIGYYAETLGIEIR
jgi:hypothetical protein